MVLHVDVISDVICPWCYIGKRRLEKSLAAVEGRHEVRVRWLPFQLNPTAVFVVLANFPHEGG